VSLPWEWSWALRLSAAPAVAQYWENTTALMQILIWRNNTGIVDGSSPMQSAALFSPVVTIYGTPYYYPQLFCNFGAIFLNRTLSYIKHKQ
jgi:hypothetical protein